MFPEMLPPIWWEITNQKYKVGVGRKKPRLVIKQVGLRFLQV